MRLSCDAKALAAGLAGVCRALPARSPLPALGTVLLEAGAGVLTLTATDLELVARVWLAADVQEEGAAAVPGRPLAEFVAAVTDDDVALEGDGRDLRVRSQAYRTELRGVPPAEFPDTSSGVPGPAMEVDAPAFVDAIQDVQFASSSDEGRTLLTGVLVVAADDELTLAATDGTRLAERRLRCRWSGPPTTVVVPRRALAEVGRAFRDEQAPLRIAVAAVGNLVCVRGAHAELRTRVLDGTYPDYRRLIPVTSATSIGVDADELAGRLRAVSVFARDDAHVVTLEARRGHLELHAATRDVGEAATRLAASVGGPDATLALNVRYLLDGLARVRGEAHLLFDGPLAPAVLRRTGDDYTYLIAPIHPPRAAD